ncbi:TPA: sugar ABC transporter substrate-binding protein [Candidatus Poribacteria bacterium]|nr:sugar ABC transporter substrate-binding protein [Candidatus Poribacteria bacterium]
MRDKIFWTLFILSLISSFGFDAKAKKISIGLLGKSVHPYWDVVRRGMEDAAEELDVDAIFYVPQSEDIAKQIETLETWIAMGVDGISFAPSDPDAVISVIAEAMKRGIPCISNDTDAPKSERLCYIGTDNYTAGKIAGEKMVEILNGKGKVAICTGSITAMNSLERMKGFRDVLSKYPNIVIVKPDPLVDNEDTARAVELAETALLDNPDLDAFFGVYAFNGPSAAKAVKTAGKVGKVHIVCFDTTDEHLSLIEEGVIDAAVGQRQYFMGYLSVVLLANMARVGVENMMMLLPKNEEGDVIIDTGVDVVTKDNLKDYIKLLEKWGGKR